MLSDVLSITTSSTPLYPSLNAPFGAQCFLTSKVTPLVWSLACLNAPFGARCFLTQERLAKTGATANVLMHRLALGAFCTRACYQPDLSVETRLNASFGARCFLTPLVVKVVNTAHSKVLMHLMALSGFCLSGLSCPPLPGKIHAESPVSEKLLRLIETSPEYQT